MGPASPCAVRYCVAFASLKADETGNSHWRFELDRSKKARDTNAKERLTAKIARLRSDILAREASAGVASARMAASGRQE